MRRRCFLKLPLPFLSLTFSGPALLTSRDFSPSLGVSRRRLPIPCFTIFVHDTNAGPMQELQPQNSTTQSLHDRLEEGAHEGQAQHGTRVDRNAGCRIGVAAAATAAARAGILVGIGIVALAAELALDLAAAALGPGCELVEIVARSLDVAGRDGVESAFDVRQSRECDTEGSRSARCGVVEG